MIRVNLIDYFELGEYLQTMQKSLSVEKSMAGEVLFAIWLIPPKLEKFISDDNGFETCKRVAGELLSAINEWIPANVMVNGQYSSEKMNIELYSYQWNAMLKKLGSFRSVFEAECNDVDVYSVGQIAIYRTRDLVANASKAIPAEFRADMSREALKEFDDAGRCLAFDLPTACGFHALRGTELVMDDYLRAYGVTKKLFTWNEYIKAAEELANGKGINPKPSRKVTAMLDRMRSLDRNPLMHPRDELDAASAGQLFSLTAITVAEMVKDMRAVKGSSAVAQIAAGASATLP
ncbi:hypothetical protein G6N76_06760 [Rhizobium daejeonense]|uniref:Uncharacterized protein n=1 Tax=Rhizobium daejeonense TaxID=240521 RepID=A0A6M1S2J0_9HYPH|nr:hypothetical protein [Rhizobium daejeonense]NGO63370.1 hypothetical protein [Rhizobium daejeonense]